MVNRERMQELLETKFYSNDLGEEVSIRGYLALLLSTLWEEKESFSGKRPLGNSGWDGDVTMALIRAGAMTGKIEDDAILDCDWNESDKIMELVIQEMCSTSDFYYPVGYSSIVPSQREGTDYEHSFYSIPPGRVDLIPKGCKPIFMKRDIP